MTSAPFRTGRGMPFQEKTRPGDGNVPGPRNLAVKTNYDRP